MDGASASRAWILRDAVLPFVLTRAALLAVLLAATSLPFGVACDRCDLSTHALLNGLTRWDGDAYVAIARDGYAYDPGVQSTIAFAPLLPLLMRALALPFAFAGDDGLIVAGLLVTNAALLVALVYLIAFGRGALDEATGRRAALYLLIFPTTIFLSALYAESLFLALALAAVFEARQGRWGRAGILGGLTALARPFGVLILVSLLIERIEQRRRTPGLGAGTLTLALAPAAFVAWQLWLYRFTGDPFAFLTAQTAYRRAPSAPWAGVADLFDPAVYRDPWLVLAVLVTATALVIASWRVLPRSLAAYGTVLLVATASSGTLVSFPRYALALFPMFLVLGLLGRRSIVHVPYVLVSTAAATLFTAMFAAWYWVA
jgi:hypothetical protein